ncbi:MAG: PQQ-binding-like beta-propeller repeat protein [Thermomicrobiales bacterium]
MHRLPWFASLKLVLVDRYWDEVARGGRPDIAIDPATAEVIVSVHALDHAPHVDAAFAQRLHDDLLLLFADSQPVVTDPATNFEGAPGTYQADPHAQSRKISRIWPILEIAAAALLIFSLAGVYFGTDALMSLIPGREQKTIPQEESSNVHFLYGNPARTGEMPGTGPVVQPSVLWSFVDENFNLFSAAAVVDGVAYVSNGNRVLALDANTGAKRWESPIKGIQNYSQPAPAPAPAVIDGLVFVGSTDGTFHAIDAGTGVERWTYVAGHSITASPTVVDGVVYVSTGQTEILDDVLFFTDQTEILDDVLFALDERTGKQLWTFPMRGGLTSSPAFADGLVYVIGGMAANARPAVFAVDAKTGTQRWAFQAEGFVVGTPSIANGKVCFGDSTGTFYALAAGTGEVIWKITLDAVALTPDQPAIPNQGGFTPAAIANGTIYVAGHNGVLYAFDEENGEKLWEVEMAYTQHASPIVAGNVVYIGSEQNALLALDGKNGHELWRFEADSPIHSPATVSNGVVYFGDLGIFYALGDTAIPATATTVGE